MSSKAFYFALQLPPQASPDLLRELATRVCNVSDCTPDTMAELGPALEKTVAEAASRGECEVIFEVRDGALGVSVHSGSHQIWHTSRPIP